MSERIEATPEAVKTISEMAIDGFLAGLAADGSRIAGPEVIAAIQSLIEFKGYPEDLEELVWEHESLLRAWLNGVSS